MRSTVQELVRFGPGLLGVAQMLASAAFCARFRGCDESWRYDASTGSPERAFRQRRRGKTATSERLIGSSRRESLDHLIVFGEAHLCGVLKVSASHYNEVRTHLSLAKDAPYFRRAQKLGRIATIPILGGFHHQYVRV